MNRLVLIVSVVAVAACSSSNEKKPPTKAEIAAMPLEQQCKVLADKLDPCANDYIKVSMAALSGKAKGMGDLQKLLGKKLGKKRARSKIMCVASPSKRMVDAVLTCYEKTQCPELAACVIHQENMSAARSRRDRGIRPRAQPRLDVKIRDGQKSP